MIRLTSPCPLQRGNLSLGKKNINSPFEGGRGILILLFLLFSTTITAQKDFRNWSVTPSFHYGKILKHTSKILAEVDEPSWGLEVEIENQTFGKNKWEQLKGYPAHGFSINYFHFGNHDAFGNAFGMMYYFNFYFPKKTPFQGYFRLASGIGILDKVYHAEKNPLNTAVSSRINNNTSLRLGLRWKIQDKIALHSAVSFTHYSNGTMKMPNLGINTVTTNVGLQYTFQPVKREDFIRYDSLPPMPKRFGFQTLYLITLRESGFAGGPKYPEHMLSLASYWHASRNHRLTLGLEYEYNQSSYEFAKHIGLYSEPRDLFNYSSRYMVFIGNEMLLSDRVSFLVQIGTYLNQLDVVPNRIYNRLVARYYFPLKKGENAPALHFNFVLKSHLINAEYMGFGVGVKF